MQIQRYKQTTVESCLACCLLQASHIYAGRHIRKGDEHRLLFYGLKFSRDDFVAGHLWLFEREFGLKTNRYVHNRRLYDFLKAGMKTEMVQKKICIRFIDEVLKDSLAAIVIDKFPLLGDFHYPHWILLLEKKGKGYVCYEPREGIVRNISERLLKEALISYLVRIWGAPQMITVSRPITS